MRQALFLTLLGMAACATIPPIINKDPLTPCQIATNVRLDAESAHEIAVGLGVAVVETQAVLAAARIAERRICEGAPHDDPTPKPPIGA